MGLRRTTGEKIGDWAIAAFCFMLIIICILPIINIAARSFSSGDALIRNQVLLWPVDFSFEAYEQVFQSQKYVDSLIYTAWLTLAGVVLSLVMTTLCAFPLIFDNLPFKKFFNTVALITMYFGAGTIPTYLLVRNLGLLDHPLALLLPYCLSVFNMILMRSFFYGIPQSLREAAEIDGAGPLRILIQIYIPLSLPVIATLALFYGVGRWNGYSDALMFISANKTEYHPIQLLLYNLLNNAAALDVAQQEGFTPPGVAESIKSATVMFATVPILCVYPFLQKYFIAGAQLGAVKE